MHHIRASAYSAAVPSSSDCAAYDGFLQDAKNYENSTIPKYAFDELGKIWEKYDVAITSLFILSIQLYLLIFARRRRRSKRSIWTNLVSLLYIFSELLGAIALGKLSDVKDEGKFNLQALSPFDGDKICKPDKPESLLRGLWAPVILFYLGGPDTITLLYIEETHLWLRHLISLLTQGARTCYVLIATWTASEFSVLAQLMLISGIIKYAERTWAIKSRPRAISDRTTSPWVSTALSKLKEENKLVVEGYICFQTLRPHIPGYRAPTGLPEEFIDERRNDDQKIFKRIEIELGFMYDVLFSKVGTIFTVWGFILRCITLTCAVCVLVVFIVVQSDKFDNKFGYDAKITIILLLGAIFLDMVGLLVQLVSDWAVVWASKHQSKLSSPVLFLHEHLISGRPRWSEEVGQISLLNFCTKFEAAVFNEMVQAMSGWRKLLSSNSSLRSRKADLNIKESIIDQLRERSRENSGHPSKILSMKAGEWTLSKYGLEQALAWTMNLEFGEAIVLWHLATDICYHSEHEKCTCEIKELSSRCACKEALSQKLRDEAKAKLAEAAKSLSDYMVHLLLVCYHKLPFCNTDGDYSTAYRDIRDILGNKKMTLADACERLQNTPRKPGERITVVDRAKELTDALAEEERWEIMSSMWVEMLCYAAKECTVKYHAQELRHGGEFLTHVWLLLMHFGIYGDQERIIPSDLRPTAQEGIKSSCEIAKEAFGVSCFDGISAP